LVKKIIIVKNAIAYTWDWYCHLVVDRASLYSTVDACTEKCPTQRHLRKIDRLMTRTACLVCLISIVNGRSKEKEKKAKNVALVLGISQTLSNLLFSFDIYGLAKPRLKNRMSINSPLKACSAVQCSAPDVYTN
jgi:hypothetical protein